MSNERLTLVPYDALRDSRHRDAQAAGDQLAWLDWLELGGISPRTLDSYERNTAVLLRMFPSRAFAEFTDADLLAVLMSFPAKSRRVRKAAYASWFRWGFKTRRLPFNPVDYLPDIKTAPQPVIEIFTDAEEAILTGLPSPDGHLMTVLFETGIRRQEARMLRLRRCNMHTRQVIIADGAKGSKERVIAMTPRLATALANLELLEGLRPDDYLWHTKPGGGSVVWRSRPIGETSFITWWRLCLERAGVKYRKPHTTRHTFATRWRQRGLAIDDIQTLLGHSSYSTTRDLYVHTEVSEVAARMYQLLELAG